MSNNKETLTVTAIQQNIVWQNKRANFLHLEAFLQQIPHSDIIVLPEMFQTGFSMQSEKLAEPENDLTLNWLQKQAARHQSAIVASFIVKEKGQYYNRLFWVTPDGNYQTYNKRHLFRMAHENNYFSAGSQQLIVHYKGWKIMPLVCYDLRFPVWSRNNHNNQPIYDLLIYVANWPEPRTNAWNKLLEARAIENLTYVVGTNRCGTDGNNITYKGNTAIIDYKGNAIQLATPYQEEYISTQISLDKLQKFRQKFPAYLDADKFKIIV